MWYCKVKLSRCAPWGARALEGRQPRHEAKHKRKEKNGTRANADRAWARSAYVSHRRRTAQNFYFVARKKRRGQAPQQGKHRKSLFFETVLLGAPLIDSSAVNYTKYEFCVRSHGDRAKRVAEHNRICGDLPVRRAPCGAIMQTLRAVPSRRSASTRGATEATGGEAVRRDVARAEPKRAGRAGAHQRRASARASQRLWRASRCFILD